MMRYYTQPHRFYAGVDLHARSMFTHVLDHSGQTVFQRDLPARPASCQAPRALCPLLPPRLSWRALSPSLPTSPPGTHFAMSTLLLLALSFAAAGKRLRKPFERPRDSSDTLDRFYSIAPRKRLSRIK